MNARQPEEAVFAAALQLVGDERAAYLDRACAGDVELRQRLEARLAAHDQAPTVAQEAEAPARPPNPTIKLKFEAESEVSERIGRYKLLQKIGEGGCGVVYMAEQEEPVRRRVALKVIKPGMDTKQVLARFEAERQALALMDHPNIAKVFDGGATENGRPFFVMELVKGVRITEYCDENKLSTQDRLALFSQVCQAIQHAHQKGIIHRDIKPSNILVADHDGVPVPKVIDFGIAKATTDQRLTDKTLFTALEQFIGAPAYMSPEQARMSGLDIDTRSDIYSLGVLLYELLTGKTPFDAKRLLEAGFDEIRRIIREEEPPRPSTRLSTLDATEQTILANHRHSEPPKLLGIIRGDLDWIVMKALEKDRNRRYETANGLAMDLQRYLNSEPIVARPPSNLYRFQKMIRRNKLPFAAAGAIGLVIVLGVLGVAWQALRATRAEREQSQLRQKAELAQANEAKQSQQAEAAREGTERFRKRTYAANIQNAAIASETKNYNPTRIGEQLDKYIPVEGEPDLRGFEWWHLDLCRNSNYTNHNQLDGFQPTCVAFKGSKGNFYLGSSNGTIGLVDGVNLAMRQTWSGHTEPVRTIALSPNRTRLATSAGLMSRVWSLPAGTLETELPLPAVKLAFITEDSIVALSGKPTMHDSTAVHLDVWSIRDRQLVRSLASDCVDFDVVQNKTTNVIASLSGGSDLTISSLPEWTQITRRTVPAKWQRIALSPTADAVAGLDAENRLAAIRLSDGLWTPALLDDYSKNPATNQFACFSWWPDGDVLVCGSMDFSVQKFLYHPASYFARKAGMLEKTDFYLLKGSSSFGSALIGLNGESWLETVVTSSGLLVQKDRRFQTTKTISNAPSSDSAGYPLSGCEVVFDSRGKRAAIYQQRNGLFVFDIDERREVMRITNDWSRVALLGFTKDNSGIQLVSYPPPRQGKEEARGHQTAIETWDLKSGRQLAKATLEGATIDGPPHRAYLSPDCRWLVGPYFGPDPRLGPFSSTGLGVWDATKGTFQRRLDRSDGHLESCAISPTDNVVAAALDNGGVYLWTLDSDEVKMVVTASGRQPQGERAMVFTPDGHCLLVANTQSALGARGFKVVELERYDLAKIQHPTKINLLVNENHDFWGFRRLQIAYSPDGRTLVAADGDTARLFSAEGGEAYITLPFGGQGSDIGGVFFAPDVRTLSAVSLDGHVKFWFARRGVDR